MEQDKRRETRHEIDLKAGYVPANADAETGWRGKARIVNVSRGGFLLQTPPYEPLGGDIRGRIFFPAQEEPISFRALQVWKRRAGPRTRLTGFRFTEMSDLDRNRLDALLKSVFIQTLTVY